MNTNENDSCLDYLVDSVKGMWMQYNACESAGICEIVRVHEMSYHIVRVTRIVM